MAAGAGSRQLGMLGLVVHAAHLPPGPRLRSPSLRPAPGAPRFRPSSTAVPAFPSAVGAGGVEAPASVSREWLLRADSSPGRPKPGEPHPPAHLCPPRSPPSWGLPATPGWGGAGPNGPLNQRRICILQFLSRSQTTEEGTVEVPEFLCGFRGRHLVGRGLKCLSCRGFSKHWTPDCLC